MDGNRPGDFSAFDEGTTGWTIEADGFHTYASDDTLEAGLTSLRTLQESRTKVDAYVMRPNGRMLSGEAIITSVVEGGQYEGVLSGSYVLRGVGPLVPTGGPVFHFDAAQALSGASDGDPVTTLPNLFSNSEPDMTGTGTARIEDGTPHVEFNGATDTFSADFTALPNGETPVSIVASVRVRAKMNGTLFATTGATQYDLHFLDPGGLEMNMGGSAVGEIPYPNGQWLKVAAVILPGRGRYYRVNGNQTFIFDPSNYVIPEGNLHIGSEGGTHYLLGDVRSVQLYNGVLSHPMISYAFRYL